jgi:hypothetical protein
MTELNPDALRQAFVRELPYHPSWPPSFDDAMADPLIAGILALAVRHAPAFARRRSERSRIGFQGLPDPRQEKIALEPDLPPSRALPATPPPPVERRRAPPWLCGKMRAAGERDE